MFFISLSNAFVIVHFCGSVFAHKEEVLTVCCKIVSCVSKSIIKCRLLRIQGQYKTR